MALNLFTHYFHQYARSCSVVISKSPRITQVKHFSTVVLPHEQENVSENKKDADTVSFVNPLRYGDYFNVNNLFTVKDLFDARVHFGHKEGSLDDRMRPFIFGSRLGHLIFDLEQTAEHLRAALNFVAHIAYRGGVILFVSNYYQHCELIERTAIECKEYAHARIWHEALFLNTMHRFKATIRLPDVCIMLNTLNDVLHEHPVVMEASKMCIPVVGVVDTNCNPNLITYPIPGNDDSYCAIELYCNAFKQAILRGKEERHKILGE